MKSFLTTAALLAATASADLCAHGSTDDNGNYYCQEVKAITYTGVGGSGSYNKVTNMDGSSGSCSSSPFGYSGSLSPLDEEVSMHFRGPLKLLKFAYYAPDSSSSKKRSVGRKSAHERRHAHGHAHQHLHHARDAQPAEDKRALGDMVTATINGLVQTWANDYAGAGAASTPTAAASPESYGGSSWGNWGSGSGSESSESSSSAPSTSAASSSSSSSDDDDDSSSSGFGWSRKGYYCADDGTSDGITFLNHQGGSGSGTFDYTFGNSLSYSSADGKSGASSPQTLEACTLDSDTEVIIMTDDKCSGDGCGYYRDGTVAYHGFDGPSKAFFFEFEMPDDGQSAASIYDPVNMPAIWLLNAQIPRTLQYGKSECSCWESGCGEFDIFEVLAPGDTRCKSTLHGNIAGGDSDYFARPTNGSIKAALLLYKDNIHIKVLDDNVDFGKTMGSTFFTEMIADTAADSLNNLVSLFKLSG
ncbi:hypothetical protein PRZ48_009959 [Zasmidium cellare]|uniref:glucan endo-1,3-beta-D-glucosidase n=1 Tax=Zasmidium cellare TaxID=395010 RepID=A0ABR0ED74_ZASCE|nr:hypothetical protein PRZ48_009959 [Zasmidium cellare]